MKTKTNYSYKIMPTVIGKLKLIASEKGLAAILWENDKPSRVRLGPLTEDKNHPILLRAERELAEYLEGKRKVFSVKFDPAGTPFQSKVWDALEKIPFGETRSYGQIAKQIGNPTAVRAVGAAIGRNPLSVMVPCHRVIGASGDLTGFAGGLDMKKRLLALEGVGSGKGAAKSKK
ncbi:MAG TPA: methylated-DNA--[protein]-cysteine S-methyltransferase [Candidatus Polarisedimenticolia bacterium]|nr:methylated-DNA--[protein]-cysteine S-methyltransferase [Candidatus Polarisedimenticolia bacterium]